MFKTVTLALCLVISGFLVFVATRPSEFFIQREATVQAPPEVIFPYINNSKLSNSWMPWKDSDPSAEMVYSGPEEGIGATTSWDSKGQMGTGEAKVVESYPNEKVRTLLSYSKPMDMVQMAEISLTPTEAGTVVKWSVSGHNSFLGRLFCVFMDMDKMVGGEFEKGLAKLKQIVETPK